MRCVPRTWVGFVCLAGVSGCPDDPVKPPEGQWTPSTKETSTTLRDQAFGFDLKVAPGWRRKATAGGEPKTLYAFERETKDKTSLVAPRMAITVEPAKASVPQVSFQWALKELQQNLASNPKVRVTRTGLSTRQVGPHKLGDLELSYEMSQGSLRQAVYQRAILVLLRSPDGSRNTLSFHFTYLKEDRSVVDGEVEDMIDSLVFLDSMTDNGGGRKEKREPMGVPKP